MFGAISTLLGVSSVIISSYLLLLRFKVSSFTNALSFARFKAGIFFGTSSLSYFYEFPISNGFLTSSFLVGAGTILLW